MKVIAGAYPEESNWQEYVTLPGNALEHNVNKVFLYRIAAFGRDQIKPSYGEKISFTSTSGIYRTMQRQVELYLNATSESRAAGKVAVPGTSWHGFGLAADLSSIKTKPPFANEYDKFKVNWRAKDQTVIYNNYGFAFCVRNENWHIQPIESIEWSGKSGNTRWKRAYFADADDYFLTETGFREMVLTDSKAIYNGTRLYVSGNDVKYLQSLLSIKETGVYDETTVAAVKEFQLRNGLKVDGVCGQSTWRAILKGNAIPIKVYYPSTGTATTTTTTATTTANTTNTKYDEEIQTKEWQSFYEGDKGIAATTYLEKVRNLEIQERRAEELAIAKAKAEVLNQSHVIEDTEEFNQYIEKWETILNSNKTNDVLIEDTEKLLYKSDSPYPSADTSLSRDAYISSVLSTISYSSDLSQKKNYESFFNINILKDKITLSSLDRNDPWAGIARKDVLATLHFLLIEMANDSNKNGQHYSKVAVSLARNLELKKPKEEQSLEHYCGLAADVYLPKTTEGVIIIKAEDVADILFSMGIKNIGIAADYVHFDLAGNIENFWSIDNYPAYSPTFVTLDTVKMQTPQVFL